MGLGETVKTGSEIGRKITTEAIRQVLYTTINVVLFLSKFKLAEVFYDPIFARSNRT